MNELARRGTLAVGLAFSLGGCSFGIAATGGPTLDTLGGGFAGEGKFAAHIAGRFLDTNHDQTWLCFSIGAGAGVLPGQGSFYWLFEPRLGLDLRLATWGDLEGGVFYSARTLDPGGQLQDGIGADVGLLFRLPWGDSGRRQLWIGPVVAAEYLFPEEGPSRGLVMLSLTVRFDYLPESAASNSPTASPH